MKGFMGMAWDGSGVAFDVETWRQALRVLKPGGHLLAFSGTRTYHRMVCAIEDAGFEIRDQIGWLYGSGFPKSLDVSKAIDKARTEDLAPLRVVCRGIRAAMDARGLKSKHLVEHFGGCDPRLVDHWAARDTDSQPSLPTWQQWETLRKVLPEIAALDAEAWRLNGRKGTPGAAWSEAEILGEHGGQTPGFVDHRFSVVDKTIREPSDAARQWQGWGTALKPAWEPIVVARKPLIGTVAANVLAHGTGAINVDGCRVESTDSQLAEKYASVQNAGARENSVYGSDNRDRAGAEPHALGRWPANIIHDGSDEVLAAFPQAPGQLADASSSSSRKTQNVYGEMKRGNGREGEPSADSGNEGAVGFKMKPGARRLDDGSAARFFYCAKASKRDRGDDNVHPTVKPTELMRYLCRLVTPPGGQILDPFTGSGSTGKAAVLEGFNFIGCELSDEYADIAELRIGSALFGDLA